MAGRSKDVAGAYRGVAVTKSDTTILPVTRAIYVGTTGDVAVIFAGDTVAVTMVAPALGVEHAWQVTKVMSTNTTAGSIVALY
jgi:hypothetical protein